MAKQVGLCRWAQNKPRVNDANKTKPFTPKNQELVLH